MLNTGTDQRNIAGANWDDGRVTIGRSRLGRRETIDVGMVPLDWGRWMMHCHILEHAEAGVMTEVQVGD